MYQLWHNPRCSKSREALAYLQQQSTPHQIFLYLEASPSAEDILAVCAKLDQPITTMIRGKEDLFKILGLSLTDERTQEEWAEILAEHPKLIERPILVGEKKAAIGRPLDNIKAMV